MADNYFVSMWQVMEALKYNLLLRQERVDILQFRNLASWNLGFVFSRTPMPALTVFPVSATFGPRMSGGLQQVEYRIVIEIYSKRVQNLDTAKKFCVQAGEDVQRGIKEALTLPDKAGVLHSLSTRVVDQNMRESRNLEDRGLRLVTSTEVSCMAYHQMNADRVLTSGIVESDYDTFFDQMLKTLRLEMDGSGVRQWIGKTSKLIQRTPAVLALPQDEVVDETASNSYLRLERPVQLHVVSQGFPQTKMLKANINLADKLVAAVEKNPNLLGHTQDVNVRSIEYVTEDQNGFMFISAVDVDYVSRRKLVNTYV